MKVVNTDSIVTAEIEPYHEEGFYLDNLNCCG